MARESIDVLRAISPRIAGHIETVVFAQPGMAAERNGAWAGISLSLDTALFMLISAKGFALSSLSIQKKDLYDKGALFSAGRGFLRHRYPTACRTCRFSHSLPSASV